MESEFSANDILIGTTTVIEASRLVSDPKAYTSDTRYKTLRLLELCSLAEAVVLHDTLFTLRSQLPDDGVDSLQLRRRLLDAGILKEIRSPIILQEIIPQITEWITSANNQPMNKDSIAVINEILLRIGDRRDYDPPVLHKIYLT